MRSWILKEFQIGVLKDLKKRKSRGANLEEIIQFLIRLASACQNVRMKMFLLVLVAIETKEASQSDRQNKTLEAVI